MANQRTIAIMAIAQIGARMAMIDIVIEPPSSIVASNGLARPPVPAVDAPRANTVVPWTSPAIPPPAMIARVHFKNGLVFVTIEAVIIVPATIAAGEAIVSNRWSTHGI